MIANAIEKFLSSARLSSGDNLLGFEMDVVAYLESEIVLFENVHAERTGNNRKAIVVTAEVRNSKPDEVAAELEHIWVTKLRYRHWEQHVIAVNPTSVRLSFATTTGRSTSDLLVTGEIVVSLRQN